MAIDPRYQDNLIFKNDAYQNLLTNIKNYPVIDIDYMTEGDIDENSNDNVWSGYTDGMPCIKVTYGDNMTTKGNIIFKEENRSVINAANKQIQRLTEIKNEYLRRRARWQKIYFENYQLIEEKKDLLQQYGNQIVFSDQDKYDFLIKTYRILYKWNPANSGSEVPLISSVSNTNTGVFPIDLSFNETFPDLFEYHVVQMIPNSEIQAISQPTETHTITIGLNFIKSSAIPVLLNRITSIKNACINNAIDIYMASLTEEEREAIAEDTEAQNEGAAILIGQIEEVCDSFREFIQYYNTLIFVDGIKEKASIPDGYNFLKPLSDTINPQYNPLIKYYVRNSNSTELNPLYTRYNFTDIEQWTEDINNLYIFKMELPTEIQDLLIYTNYEPNYNFQSYYSAFIEDYNKVVNSVIAVINSNLIQVNENLAGINEIINWLDGDITGEHLRWDQDSNDNYNITNYTLPMDQSEFDPETETEISTYPKTVFLEEPNQSTEEVSIYDYRTLVNLLEQQMLDAARDHDGTNDNDHTLYGYKYVKVGSNIQFTNNYDNVNSVEPNVPQTSGTFRITINGHIYEVPIKGLGPKTSEQSIKITSGGTDAEPNSQIILYSTPQTANEFDIGIKGKIHIRDEVQMDTTVVVGGDLLPGPDTEVEDIGASNQRWGTIYANDGNFSGDLLPDNTNEATPHYIPVAANAGYDSNKTYYTINGNNEYVEYTWDVENPPSDSDEDGYLDNVYVIDYYTNAENIGASDNHWNCAYVDSIVIGSGNNPIVLGDAANESQASGDGNGSPKFLGVGGWTDTLTGALKITNTGDGIEGTTRSEQSPYSTTLGDRISGNTLASIYTQGGIYAVNNIYGERVFNAVFNDYAEYRTTIDAEAGKIVVDNDNGSLSLSSMRLQPGAQVISDTFGHAMGATDKCQTPLAVAGRALVYTYKDRNEYHAGMAVCSAPNGTVDIMTREEIREYPDCIIGIVSEIPDYEVWGSNNVKVNGRIWIKVR